VTGSSDEPLVEVIARAVDTMRAAGITSLGDTGLSTAGAAWALETTLAELTPAAMRAALGELRALGGEPARRHGLVLAGNVFTACMRPIVWSLLARVPVTVKVASSDAGLAEGFGAALVEASAEMAEAVRIVRFSRAMPERYDELAASVDVISVHGSDRTIEALRARTPETTRFVAHGHGLGLAVIARDAAVDQALMDALALDVAAYDQHGCLSPMAVLVEEGGAVAPREVASMLAGALGRVEVSMPRGALSEELAAAQMQWRGVAASLYALHDGGTHAVSFEGDAAIRETPGHRNVAVHSLADLRQLPARVAMYGEHLKALGVAGTVLTPATVTPIVSALGRMQRPRLAALTDGLPPWEGLVSV
jgi:hypothetical protein